MNPTVKFLQLALLLASPLTKVVAFEDAEFVVDASVSMIRGGSVGMDDYSHHGRELSFTGSWSWTNLLCKSNEMNALLILRCISSNSIVDRCTQFTLVFATPTRIARLIRIPDHVDAQTAPSHIHHTFKEITVKTSQPPALKVMERVKRIPPNARMARMEATEVAK
jgi:hypothetical protein